jgi:hypothetical protein
MAKRRPSVAASKPAKLAAAPPVADRGTCNVLKPISRARLTTGIRSDFVTALRRASLERRLSGQTPNTVQDILEEALEPWLRKHDYIE